MIFFSFLKLDVIMKMVIWGLKVVTYQTQVAIIYEPKKKVKKSQSNPGLFLLCRFFLAQLTIKWIVQVQREEMGFQKDVGVWWNALITFGNCNVSSCSYWLARGNRGTSFCTCFGFGMRCTYLIARSCSLFFVNLVTYLELTFILISSIAVFGLISYNILLNKCISLLLNLYEV